MTSTEPTPRFKNSSSSTSSVVSSSLLQDIYFQGYNSFDTANIINNNIIADDGDIEYESAFQLSPSNTKYPTDSQFSMYSQEFLDRMHAVNKAINNASTQSKPSMPSVRMYTFWGEIYRKCCFTETGMKFILSINIILVLLNIFLILYEIILIFQTGRYHDFLTTHLPIEFFICDVLITVILIIEVLGHWYIGYMCNCHQYLCTTTYDNKVDVMVMSISIICCVLYVTDFGGSSDIDNLVFLGIRITRDIIRIIRCVLFFKLLYGNLKHGVGKIVDVNHVPISKIGKLKSARSQLLWDTYLKQKALNPQATMLKIVQSNNSVIEETEPIDHTLDDNQDIVFVPSKVKTNSSL